MKKKKKKQDNQPEIKKKTKTENTLCCKNKQKLIQRDIIGAITIVI